MPQILRVQSTKPSPRWNLHGHPHVYCGFHLGLDVGAVGITIATANLPPKNQASPPSPASERGVCRGLASCQALIASRGGESYKATDSTSHSVCLSRLRDGRHLRRTLFAPGGIQLEKILPGLSVVPPHLFVPLGVLKSDRP